MTKDGKQDGRATLAEIFAASRNRDLSDSELRLWLAVRYLDRGKGCYASTETLAAELHCSRSKVEKLRAGLVGREWLDLTFRGPKEPVLRAVTPLKALHDSEELEPEQIAEALHNNEELGTGSFAPSSSPSFAESCKQSTGGTGKENTTPPIPSPREGSDAESGTDPPGPAPGEEVALQAEEETGTASSSSLPSENGRPSAGRFPSREYVELFRPEWWLGDRPPPGAPEDWSIDRELAFHKRQWQQHGDEARLFVLGVRMMADRGELKAKGRDGVLRVVPLGEGFTAALIEARLDFDPAFFHEAVGQARKAEELQYARDGPDRTSGEDDRLRRLAEEAIGAK